MTKPEWGTKRTCLNCGTRFYDMQKTPIVCPKCGSENAPDAVGKARRSVKKAPAHAVETKPKAVAPRVADEESMEDEVELEVDDDEDDDALIEDTDDLAEDDDMAEVIDHLGPEDED